MCHGQFTLLLPDPAVAKDRFLTAFPRFAANEPWLCLLSHRAARPSHWSAPHCDRMISEVRYVTRSLFRRKGFALVTVLTLALGIGSATAVYAMVDWFLFQAPTYPSNLFMIGNMSEDGRFVPTIFEFQFKA